ncbi:MAG: DUF881 domain-containing protein [Actinobacteria bacterium]|nr:DUF881 domain-containing protein [Actinomycetota bacterium]
MNTVMPIPDADQEDSMRLLYRVLDDANHSFGPPIPKGQKSRFTSVFAGASVFVIIGIFFGVAIGLTRQLEPISDTTRQQLQERIATIQSQLSQTQETLEANISNVDEIRANTSLQSQQIRNLNSSISALELLSGYTAIRGDGIRVEIQASVTPSYEDGVDLGVVIDSDIARVVNGLLAHGAIAVSVNDYRITSKSAIRSAGEAILVGYRPLTPPYVILAIGDSKSMLLEMKTGKTGEDITEISNTYGVRFSTYEMTQITIPQSLSPVRNRVPIRIIK